MYPRPVWNIIAAFTVILTTLLSHNMKATNQVLLVGCFRKNMSNLLTIVQMARSNQTIDPLHPVTAIGLHKHLI